jgi:nicotinamide phosphoribosyltransferase
MENLPVLLCDFYKVSHREQYPDNTEMIYSTWTPRSNTHHPTSDFVINFGLQAFIQKYLIDYFNENFFEQEKCYVIATYKRFIKFTLGVENPDATHIEDLWELGYLPLEIRALKEGIKVPMRVPIFEIYNTDPKFFWVTNYIETLLSTELWLPMTTATIAYEYKKILDFWCDKTGGDKELVQFQAHDFSMRGMSSLDASTKGGAGHLLSFTDTDVIPSIMFLEKYYGADIEKELVGCSIPATEHSVMCAGGMEDEFETYKRLIPVG